MQSALQLNSAIVPWIAGHADPSRGIIMVTIPPGPAQSLEIRRQVPHELNHVLLYQKLGERYQLQPRWLMEGLASNAELFPHPDYPLLLEKAPARGVLIPFEQLCSSFPTDAANFQLAYAQSSSLVWYLQSEYGTNGLEALLSAYGGGLGCERGAETALGAGLSELERDWRQVTFNESPWRNSLQNILPWLFILLAATAPPFILLLAENLQKRN
jgi:hypothetical protein